MRLIPRNTRVKTNFYKGITVTDIVIAFVGLALVTAALSSNLPFKFPLAIVIGCFFIPLFISTGDERIYKQIFYLGRFILNRKKFFKDGKDAANIDCVNPYENIENDILVNKDESYTGVIEIKPLEFRLIGSNKQNYLIDGILTRALSSLNSNQTAAIVKLERTLNLDNYIADDLNRLTELANAREAGTLKETEYRSRVDIIEDRLSLVDALNSEEIIQYSAYYLTVTDTAKDSLKNTLSNICVQLFGGSIETHILKDRELWEFLAASERVSVDDKGCALSLPEKLTFRLTSTQQDNLQISHFTITNYPLKVSNAWGTELFDMPNTKVVMKLKPVEKYKAIKRIDNAITELSTQNRGKASVVIDKTTHLETLSELLIALQNDNEVLFDVTILISVYDDKGNSANRKAVKRKTKECGYTINEMFGRQSDAYLTSGFTKYDAVKASRGIQASSVAASFPFVSNAIQDEGGILIGENSLPAFVNFFKRNGEYVNSNMIVIGKSGGGKSYAVKTLLAHFASMNYKIFVLDPEGEYLNLAKNLGGKILDTASPKHGRLNPLQIIRTLDDDCEDGTCNSFFTHLQFLEEFYKTVMPGIGENCLELLNKLTTELYKKKGITPTTDISALSSTDYPIFDDLNELILKKLSLKSGYDKAALKLLEIYLSKFRSGGRYSNLWNGPSDFETDENFICFDFQKLLANKNGSAANAQMLLVLKYLENEVIKNRELNEMNDTDRKVIVVVDEAHLFIDEKYPAAIDFMFQIAKRIRKYDGMEIVITQSLKDFTGSPETARKAAAIIAVSQYSLIFSLPPNDMSDLCALYEKAGQINAAEAENIVHNERGCAFLISSPESRTNIRIVATPFLEMLSLGNL